MLPTPQFYATASLARHAVTAAVKRHPPGCTVNDILVRVDPDAGEWFGIVSLDADATDVLVSARKFLPEFRVIGEPLHMESSIRPAQPIKKAR
jgi:hypothetical protein